MRIAPFLAEDEAEALLESWREQPYELTVSHINLYQYFRADVIFEAACDHPICRLGRWLHGVGCDVVGDLAGVPLDPPPDEPYVTGNLYVKGCYLDAHTDAGKGRAVAYVLGLTRPSWSADVGGYLEFTDGQYGPVLEARAPGWNSMDLFDVTGDGRWHRVSLVRQHVDRVTVSGWFYPKGFTRSPPSPSAPP